MNLESLVVHAKCRFRSTLGYNFKTFKALTILMIQTGGSDPDWRQLLELWCMTSCPFLLWCVPIFNFISSFKI